MPKINQAGNLQRDRRQLQIDHFEFTPQGGAPQQVEAWVMPPNEGLRQASPGLAQLDRSKIGQVFHSKVRDAAATVGRKLKP